MQQLKSVLNGYDETTSSLRISIQYGFITLYRIVDMNDDEKHCRAFIEIFVKVVVAT